MRPHGCLALAALAFLCAATPAAAQTVVPPFDTDYSIVDLGTVPGLPTNNGGLVFLVGDPNTLLIGGAANQNIGALYSIALVRDVNSRITGFSGTATLLTGAPYVDGGVAYGPGGVIFVSRYNVNQVGQIKPGSTLTDKVVDLTPLGVNASIGGLNFVPAGFSGAGQLKVVSFNTHDWYTLDISPDGNGTFDIIAATWQATLAGGPEGFAYIPKGSPQFADFGSILISEYSANQIAVYDVDANGDPIPATRTSFVTGLTGAEGAAIDPLTGDLLFSTFSSGNRIIAVQGFGIPCGNGTLDPGEQCDDVDSDCCSSQCQFELSSVECRAAVGVCDATDFCTGTSPTCPADGFITAGTVCRPAAGVCDIPDMCSGTAPACPADAKSTAECRPAAGACDLADSCDGTTDECPPDALAPDGTACDDGDFCTTQDECAAGICVGTSLQTCAPCESCDPAGGCRAAPWSACRQPIAPRKSRLVVKNGSADKKDRITWKWKKGALTVAEHFGDPHVLTDYAVCLYDEGGIGGAPRAVMAATIPAAGTCAGQPCWKSKSKGFKYKDKEQTPDGIKVVVLKPGGNGKAGIVVKGKGDNLPLPRTLDITGTVTMQLQAGNGECWEATYSTPIKNSSSKFKAKSQ